jgi:HEAT repeat protein
MKIKRILFATLSLLLISVSSYSQDKRTLDTKIADLLAQFPANDLQYSDKLMGDMLALGEEGLNKICSQIVPSGTGDDTKARFAVDTFSRYLSRNDKVNEKTMWEKICISFATRQKDDGVKDFFIKQLQLIGGDQTAEAMKIYLSDKDNCTPAIAAITAVGGKTAEHILAESLKSRDLPCVAAIMNALAAMKSDIAVNEYIYWSSDANINTKASAYNALAQSGSPLAYPVLLKAAKSYFYRWERTGATAALLNYAKNVAQKGDLKTMDKICRLLMSKCNDKLTFQNKTAALGTFVSFHGIDAMPEIIKAAGHPDKKYRNAAINMTASIQGSEVVKKWIDYFPKAIPDAKPEILGMLGARGDQEALTLIYSSLNSNESAVRSAAAEAVAKISGKNGVTALIGYMMKFSNASDQDAAITALKRVAGNDEIKLLKPVLKDGSPAAKKSAIELMAWNKGHEYFSEIIPYASSQDEPVRAAAFKALASLAGSDDQVELISLLKTTDNPEYLSDIQAGIATAANKIADPEKRSSVILKAMESKTAKGMLIPILASTGGREALTAVLKEFEEGNPEIREKCFAALSSWKDYSASSALYEICASGNKTYEAPAFKGYVKQVKSADVPDEQKLLLFRKIMPFALTPEVP